MTLRRTIRKTARRLNEMQTVLDRFGTNRLRRNRFLKRMAMIAIPAIVIGLPSVSTLFSTAAQEPAQQVTPQIVAAIVLPANVKEIKTIVAQNEATGNLCSMTGKAALIQAFEGNVVCDKTVVASKVRDVEKTVLEAQNASMVSWTGLRGALTFQ